ncbi:hypothetical protein D6779_04400 [Candidatus Parcubacteria bacterium]|nr:MAG: hypothetical protein D6779_04400 [Candidatus Parcubacteria bacterium]
MSAEPTAAKEEIGSPAHPKQTEKRFTVFGIDWQQTVLAALIGLSVTGVIQFIDMKQRITAMQAEIEARPKVLVVDLVDIVSRLPNSLTEDEKSKVMNLFSQYMENKIREGYMLLQPMAEFAPIKRWRIPDAVIEDMIYQVTKVRMQMRKPAALPRVGTMKFEQEKAGEQPTS